jgi:hypothetical protein
MMFDPNKPFGPEEENPDVLRRRLIQEALAKSLSPAADNSAALAKNESSAKDLTDQAQLLRAGNILGSAFMGRQSTGDNLGSQGLDNDAKALLGKNLEMKNQTAEAEKRRAEIAKAFGLQDTQDAAQLFRQRDNNEAQYVRDEKQGVIQAGHIKLKGAQDKELKGMDLAAKAADTRKSDENRAKAEASLRKEIEQLAPVKTFNKLESEMGRFNQLKGQGGGQPDEARIMLWNKFLDPESVVREGEFARSRDAQPLIDKIKLTFGDKPFTGSSLTDTQRAMMDQLMGQFYEAAKSHAINALPRYDKTITDYGYDRARVLPYWATGVAPQPEQQPVAGAPEVGAVVKGYRFKGGSPKDKNNGENVN